MHKSLHCQSNNILLHPESSHWIRLCSTVSSCGRKGTEVKVSGKKTPNASNPNTSAAVAVWLRTQAIPLGGACLG